MGVALPEPRGRDSVLDHEVFGEDLASLDAGGVGGRAENGESSRLEPVNDSGDERRFRTYNGKIDVLGGGEIGQSVEVVRAKVDALRVTADSGISGRAINLRRPPA